MHMEIAALGLPDVDLGPFLWIAKFPNFACVAHRCNKITSLDHYKVFKFWMVMKLFMDLMLSNGYVLVKFGIDLGPFGKMEICKYDILHV